MKKSLKNNRVQEIKYHIVGWVLFVLCAIFFLGSSIKNRDTLTFIGSILFLMACIVFIIPLVRKKESGDNTKAH